MANYDTVFAYDKRFEDDIGDRGYFCLIRKFEANYLLDASLSAHLVVSGSRYLVKHCIT